MAFFMNITITILSNTLTKSVGLPADASSESLTCLLRDAPNDWLSPTDRILGTYGVGQRGALHPIPLFILRTLANQCGTEASARICYANIISPRRKNVNLKWARFAYKSLRFADSRERYTASAHPSVYNSHKTIVKKVLKFS